MSTRGDLSVARTPAAHLLLVVAAVGAAALLVHGGALGGRFHYDDVFTVVNNPAVRSWQPLRAFMSADAVSVEQQAAGYRPLTVTSLALNHRVSGLEPFGYLATNLALHAISAGLVALIAWELLGSLRWAAVAGALFALHPVNAEAVNYVTARSSLLSILFSLAAIWAFIRYAECRGRAKPLVCGLVAYGAALLSKESAVALIVPMLIYGVVRRPRVDRDARPVGGALAGFVAVSVGYLVVYGAITAGGVAARAPASYPGWTYVELVGRSLLLWVWPWPLGLDHPLTFVSRFDTGLAVSLVLGAGGVAVALAVTARRVPIAVWGMVWALAGLLPLAPLPWLTTVGLFQEHRIGFSAAGLSWTTAALLQALLGAAHGARSRQVLRVVLACMGGVFAVGAVGLDRFRSSVWEDDRRLWSEVVRRSPENLVARLNLGVAYMDHGDFQRAEAEYRAVITALPASPQAHYNLGLLALRRGSSEDAMVAFRRTVHLDPRNAAAHAHLGILALRAGDEHGAETAFEVALRNDPAQRDALNNLAAIYLERREWGRALQLVDVALHRDATFLEAAYNKGVALAGLGRRAEADAVLRDVRARLPSDPAFDKYRAGVEYLLAGGTP